MLQVSATRIAVRSVCIVYHSPMILLGSFEQDSISWRTRGDIHIQQNYPWHTPSTPFYTLDHWRSLAFYDTMLVWLCQWRSPSSGRHPRLYQGRSDSNRSEGKDGNTAERGREQWCTWPYWTPPERLRVSLCGWWVRWHLESNLETGFDGMQGQFHPPNIFTSLRDCAQVAVKVLRHHISDEHAGNKFDKVKFVEVFTGISTHRYYDSDCVEKFESGGSWATIQTFYHFMERFAILVSILLWSARGRITEI